MGQEDFAIMAAVFAATLALASLLGWWGGNDRKDVALMGGAGTVFGLLSAALFAT